MFYIQGGKPELSDPNLTRKSNHMLARVFGDSVISRESFQLTSGNVASDQKKIQELRKKYPQFVGVQDPTTTEPKLVLAPKDMLADDPNVHELVLKDQEQTATFQKGIMATLIVGGSALLAWILSSRLK